LYCIGHFREYQAVNYVDISFGEPIDINDITYEIFGIDGRVTGKGDHKQGTKVLKSGRTTAVTEGTIIDSSWNGQVTGSRGTADYEDCVLVAGECDGGDSGSPVVSKDDIGNLLFHGALFAGATGNWVHCKVDNIERIAGVELVTY